MLKIYLNECLSSDLGYNLYQLEYQYQKSDSNLCITFLPYIKIKFTNFFSGSWVLFSVG